MPILEIEPLPELLLQSSKGVKTEILKANAAQRNRNVKIISVGLQDQEKITSNLGDWVSPELEKPSQKRQYFSRTLEDARTRPAR